MALFCFIVWGGCCCIGFLFVEKEVKVGWVGKGERFGEDLGEGKNINKLYLSVYILNSTTKYKPLIFEIIITSSPLLSLPQNSPLYDS